MRAVARVEFIDIILLLAERFLRSRKISILVCLCITRCNDTRNLHDYVVSIFIVLFDNAAVSATVVVIYAVTFVLDVVVVVVVVVVVAPFIPIVFLIIPTNFPVTTAQQTPPSYFIEESKHDDTSNNDNQTQNSNEEQTRRWLKQFLAPSINFLILLVPLKFARCHK